MLAGLAFVWTQFIFLAATLPVGGFGRYFLALFVVSRMFVAYGVVESFTWAVTRMRTAHVEPIVTAKTT